MFTNPFAATQSLTASFAQFQASSLLSKMMESITAKNDYCGLGETVSIFSAAHKSLIKPLLDDRPVSKVAALVSSFGVGQAGAMLASCRGSLSFGEIFTQQPSIVKELTASFASNQGAASAIAQLTSSIQMGIPSLRIANQAGQTLGDLMDTNGMLDDILRRAKPPKINTFVPRSKA